MNKFIIFKLQDVTPAGASVSDDGSGIEIISLPVDSISHMTAKEGEVSIFYKDVSSYDESNLSTGESIKKSVISVSCTKGEELSLIEKVSNFTGLERGDPYIIFDSTGESTFGEFTGVIKAVVKNHPVNRVTGNTSIAIDSGFTAVTSNTVNDIDFGASIFKPILDLDSRDAVFGGGGGNISAWVNAGTGGSSYNFSAVTGSVTQAAGASASGTSPDVDFAVFLVDSYITLANSLTINGDYTMYMVYVNTGSDTEAPVIYGVDAGDTSGGVGVSKNILDGILNTNIENKIGIQYQERFGDPILVDTLVPLNASSPSVLVIRRDEEFNVSVYNFDGDLVASIPAVIGEVLQATQNTANGDTTGLLAITHIGTAMENVTHSFAGSLGRFGVIPRDVGSNEAQRIAKELYYLYSNNRP